MKPSTTDFRIQSATSKNRQDNYEKYQMDQSIHSKGYDALYQHNQTNMLRDMQHLSHTEKTLSTKIRAHT